MLSGQMRRKNAEPVQRIDCDVQLAAPMSSWQAAYVAEEVIKHLLFMRNMIPSLFNDLADKMLVSMSSGSKGFKYAVKAPVQAECYSAHRK